MKLELGGGLQIPIEVAGQAVALVGIRGSGKTNTAGVIAEELLDRGQPIVVLDPTDAWWGLRSDYPVFIFGGPHGDLALNETDGKTLAEFVVQEKVPIILSLRHLRKGAQRRLVMEFCEELYHLKGKPEYREPLTVFIDEAPQFVPQRVMGEMARLVGAVQDMILLGRNVGFGVVLISQRFATLNADVRTQADTVIVHRLPSPLDRKALTEWIEENATIAEQKEVLSSLATLKTGEAWMWSPYFDLFKRAQIRPRKTFDSSAAPKRGAPARTPKDLTKVDLEKLKGKLAATIEKAKADDPRELRKHLAAAKAELAAKEKILAEVDVRTKRIDEKLSKVPVSKRDAARVEKIAELQQQLARHRRALEEAMKILVKIKAVDFSARGGEALEQAVTAAVKQITQGIEKRITALGERVQGIQATAAAAEQAIAKLLDEKIELSVIVQKQAPFTVKAGQPPRAPREYTGPKVDAGLPPAKQKVLDALAFLEGIGVQSAERAQLALMADTTPSSSAYANNLGALRSAGFVDYPTQNAVGLTDQGRAASNGGSVPSTSEELHDVLRGKLPPAKWKIVEALIASYPAPLAKDALAERADTSIASSAFANNLGSLRSLGLLDYPSPGFVVARAVLFLDGR